MQTGVKHPYSTQPEYKRDSPRPGPIFYSLVGGGKAPVESLCLTGKGKPYPRGGAVVKVLDRNIPKPPAPTVRQQGHSREYYKTGM